MDWDNESPVVPTTDEVASPVAPDNTVTVTKTQWRLARALSALVLVLVIGGGGFILGHDIVTPAAIRISAPNYTSPTLPSFGNGSGSFQIPSVTPPNTKADKAAAKIATKVDPGLVDITTTFASTSQTAEGTGMILTSDGLVLTNNHVVEDAQTLSVRDIATNATYVGKVVGYDLTQDVALIQLKDASGLTTIKTANSDKVASGEKIVGIGNAGGVGGTPSFVPGSVVALNQAITAGDETNPAGSERLSGLIEVNAAIEPGDSGGPLVNDKGKVVGMDTAGSDLNGGFGFDPGSTAGDRGYAIPINTALSIVTSIRDDVAVSGVHIGETAFLGVEFDSATAAGNTNSTSGVTIAGTVAGSAANAAGFVAGDVITSIDGQSVATGTDLQTILLTKKPGETIHVDYLTTNGVANSRIDPSSSKMA
ncbi:MAG: trypsin-like peptidase domain-containing protein [Acidimicrobiales bacterium]